MESAGRGNKDVPLVKGMRSAINNHSVFFLDGHNDLQCRMPVDRVILRLFVVIELETVESIVCNCFMNSIQYFDHIRFPFPNDNSVGSSIS